MCCHEASEDLIGCTYFLKTLLRLQLPPQQKDFHGMIESKLWQPPSPPDSSFCGSLHLLQQPFSGSHMVKLLCIQSYHTSLSW